MLLRIEEHFVQVIVTVAHICKETNAFVELQVAYFFCPNTTQANNQESKPYQPVL